MNKNKFTDPIELAVANAYQQGRKSACEDIVKTFKAMLDQVTFAGISPKDMYEIIMDHADDVPKSVTLPKHNRKSKGSAHATKITNG